MPIWYIYYYLEYADEIIWREIEFTATVSIDIIIINITFTILLCYFYHARSFWTCDWKIKQRSKRHNTIQYSFIEKLTNRKLKIGLQIY